MTSDGYTIHVKPESEKLYDSLIDTVNVILFGDSECTSIQGFYSFEETQEGNEQAEKAFGKLLVDFGVNEDEVEDILNDCDGYYELPDGKYVLLTHSTEL